MSPENPLARLSVWPFSLQLEIENWLKTSRNLMKMFLSIKQGFCSYLSLNNVPFIEPKTVNLTSHSNLKKIRNITTFE